jgi:hypothetical protein
MAKAMIKAMTKSTRITKAMTKATSLMAMNKAQG